MLEIVLISLAATMAPPFVLIFRRAVVTYRLTQAMARSDLDAIVEICDGASGDSWLPCMNHSEAHFYKAMAYCSHRRETEARACFAKVDAAHLQMAQKQFLPLLEASLLGMDGKPEEAMELISKVDASKLELTAKVTFLLLEAELLGQMECSAEAAKRLEDWLDKPLNQTLLALVRNNWAWFSIESGGAASMALHRAKQALGLCPETKAFYSTYGAAIYLSGGDPGEAIEAIEYALTGPEKAMSSHVAADHYFLGQCYASLGWRDQAIHHLSEAMDTAPKSRWAKLSRQRIQAMEDSPVDWRWEPGAGFGSGAENRN